MKKFMIRREIVVKRAKVMIGMLLMVGMLTNVCSVKAYSWKSTTQGGHLGKTDVDCTVDIHGGSSSYSQAYLSISTKNQVEKLGIKDINVILKDGGGSTGGNVSKSDAYSASYTGAAYGPNAIKSISGHYYVTSYNFGNFSKNYSY